MKSLIWILLLLCGSSACGQTLVGQTWKSILKMSRHSYAFEQNHKLTYTFQTDLGRIERQGRYLQNKDTIFIEFDALKDNLSPITKESSRFDTLYIQNPQKLESRANNRRIPLYCQEREILDFSVHNSQALNLSIRDFGDTICLQQQRNYNWVTVHAWTNATDTYLIIKNYPLSLHSGTNNFRVLVLHPIGNELIKSFSVEGRKRPVTLKNRKARHAITFSDTTHYGLYSNTGEVLVQGYGTTIDCSTLANDRYILQFDNQSMYWRKRKARSR